MEGSAVLDRRGAARSRRAVPRPPFVQRYWAFLSYSHADAAEADWLHKALERFRVPPELVGRRAERFLVPARLTPIFRDRSELAASSDLSAEIREAIETSRHLIVLCSPAAARSRWVDEEIRTFKQLRPDGEVLAAIVGGEPNAPDPAQECFPPALKQKLDARGKATGVPAEPIATDLRPSGDGREQGLLKLVAGMLDLRLDELVQREEQRRHRKWALVSMGSIAGMVLTTGLAVTAIQARDAARDQRREAESLVGFMIGDLKDKLEPVGRLDALDAVGGRVLAYYEKQDKGALSDEALAQRSKALTLMGDIAQRRGDLDGALRRYREGLAGTAEALRRDPDNPQRMFDHAQNVFWIGSISLQRGELEQTAQAWQQYRALADRMVAAEPSSPKYQLESAYADANLGTVALEQRRFAEAARYSARALGALDRLIARDPRNPVYRQQKGETIAFLADALERSGQIAAAMGWRQRQLQLLGERLRTDPLDTGAQKQAMVAHQALSRLLYFTGKPGEAIGHVDRSTQLADLLRRTEPGNAEWTLLATGALQVSADLRLRLGRPDAAAIVERGCQLADWLTARDRQVAAWQERLLRCHTLRARTALAEGRESDALMQVGQALALARTLKSGSNLDDRMQLALITKLAGDVQSAMGEAAAARRSWQQALALWPKGVGETPTEISARAELLRSLGQRGAAEQLEEGLRRSGFHPAGRRVA